MSDDGPFQKHWVEIEPERLARYEAMFQWNPATAHFYDGAGVAAGQTIADFGCGPGHAAVEFARRVGPEGHVHALDVNAAFIERVAEHATAAGVADRVTPHLLTDANLPLPDACLDCVIARNTIIYTEDPGAVFREFKRILKPGGRAHAIEGDWRLTAVEPVPADDWRRLVEAASWAWPWPEIGRQLYATAREAGFENISVQVQTSPDTTGRLHGMIQNVAGYARERGTLASDEIDAILKIVADAIADQRYLAIAPQFIVTAVA